MSLVCALLRMCNDHREAGNTVRFRSAQRVALAALAVTLVVGMNSAFALPIVGGGSTCTPTVLIKGTDWLGGQGVDVKKGCNIQCVELAERLYSTKGWGTVHTGSNGGASTIPEGSSGLDFYENGTGYVPIPGDLIIENGTSSNQYGHVSVVDTVSSTSINAVEQNASSSGWHTYTRSGSTVSGGYGSVRGFEHSPKNAGAVLGKTSVGWALWNTTSNKLEYHVDNGPLAGGKTFSSPSGSKIITGDWDGNGKTSVGWARWNGTNLEYHVDNGPLAGGKTFATPSGAYIITGDWDGNGLTSVGWARWNGTNLEYHVDNGPLAGGQTFSSPSGSYIITGNWDGI